MPPSASLGPRRPPLRGQPPPPPTSSLFSKNKNVETHPGVTLNVYSYVICARRAGETGCGVRFVVGLLLWDANRRLLRCNPQEYYCRRRDFTCGKLLIKPLQHGGSLSIYFIARTHHPRQHRSCINVWNITPFPRGYRGQYNTTL